MTTVFRYSGKQELVERTMEAIQQTIRLRGECSLMLAGGRTPQAVYRSWSAQQDFPHERITYFFGDERCVPPDSADSNFFLARNSLFPRGIPDGVRIHRMNAENPDPESAARVYEKLLPEHIDVLLLGMGEDGHIASLFPGDRTLLEVHRSVVHVVGPKPPRHRLTITPKVIASAHNVLLLANGSRKGKMLARALIESATDIQLPVRLTLGRTWFVDQEAMDELPPAFRKFS